MRKLKVVIEMENDAFEEDNKSEVRNILHELADYLENSFKESVRLRDSNGNTVGYAEVMNEED